MKTAFLTGGSSDIGQAIALLLAEHGWQVIAPSHKDLDLSKLSTIAGKVEKATKDALAIDAVVHVAGLWHDGQTMPQKDLEDYTTEQIEGAMNVGVTGFMICLRALLPKVPKDGTIVGISGTFADGASGWLPYYVSKRALEDLLVGLAEDYPSGPRVYGISPGDTASTAYKRFFPVQAGMAQPVEAVAHAVYHLVAQPDVPSGSILAVRSAKVAPGFHK